MRTLSYAGTTVVTTDRVATAAVELTAALARRGLAEAVRIPVFDPHSRSQGDAELVVGAGVEMLSVAAAWPEADPETEDAVAELRRTMERLGAAPRQSAAAHYDRVLDDPEFAHPAGGADQGAPPIPLHPRSRRPH